jgi:hypothetical protein
MDRKSFGILGALLAVVAALRTGLPIEPHSQTPVQPVVNPIATAPATPTCAEDNKVAAGPWKAVCRYFGHHATASAGPWSCVPDKTPIAFLIASVPDPKTTNLSLYFDRIVESLMWAVGDTGYTFDQYWLPWDNRPELPLLTLSDWHCRRAELEQHEEQPGVLVFRRRATAKRTEQVLLAFLVPETPTEGISKTAFENALADVQSIANQSGTPLHEIPITGPTFSGSLGPLAVELTPFLQKNPTLRFDIVSGHVTSKVAIQDFLAALGNQSGQVHYDSSIENDDRASKLFFNYVNERWFSPHEVALLSEDETAYGYLASTLPLPDPEKKLLLRYPRQIARLRNAYQDSNTSSSNNPQSSVVEGVRLTLKTSSDLSPIQLEKDTIDDLSEQQSPASQQGALAQISSDLRRERADYTGIFATDVLDSLFLSRFLRLSFPDNRIFTFDSDLLFVREGESAPFIGILAVTNYPLFGRNQHWTKAELAGGVPRRIQFTSRYAEGAYNACRYLLQKDLKDWDDQKDGEFLLEYSRPRKPHGDQPALWLTALGRDGYWPVALLDWKEPWSPSLFQSPHPSTDNDEELHPESPSRAWYLLFWLILMFSLAHCAYVFLLLCQPPKGPAASNPWLVRRAQGIYERIWPDAPRPEPPAPPPGKLLRSIRFTFRFFRDSCKALSRVLDAYPDGSPTAYELPFLLTATLVTACVVFMLTLCLSIFWTSTPAELWAVWYGRIARLALLALTVLAVALMERSRTTFIASPGNVVRRSSLKQFWPLTIPALAFAIYFCITIGWLISDPAYETGYFFAYRSLSLTSGLSPAAPVLLLAIVYFYWTWVHLRRENMISQRRLLQGLDLDLKAGNHMHRVDECLADLFSANVWRPALLFFVSWLLVLEPWRVARSIESQTFDWLYMSELALLYWMLAVVWCQFIWCWRAFRKFLQWLERSPVRNAFSRLRKETSWVPLVSKPREHQLFISSRAWNTLRALRAFGKEDLSSEQKEGLKKLQENIMASGSETDALNRELEEALGKGQDLNLDRYGELQKQLEVAARAVRTHLDEFDWSIGDSDSVRRELDSVPRKEPTAAQRLRLLEEEFVAYRYLIFIRYVFRHLRNLLMFVIVGFIFSVISMHSYPFLGLRWIGVVCWVVLVTLGIGVGMVFAQMDRDAILSRLTETKANEVGRNFFLRMLQFGALPLLTVVTTQFPAVGRLLASWLQPALQALR